MITENGEKIIILAIQKGDGRLADKSRELLMVAGLDIDPSLNGKGYVDLPPFGTEDEADNYTLRVSSMRDDDIPGALRDGVIDFGIAGLDIFREKLSDQPLENQITRVKSVGFGRCRMVLGVKASYPYAGLTSISDATVVTSFPNCTREFFAANNLIIGDLRVVSGEVEQGMDQYNAPVCVDISSSGRSFRENGIIARATLFESQAILFASKRLGTKRGSERFTEELLSSLLSGMRSRNFFYVALNAPVEARAGIVGMLPSDDSPSVIGLDNNRGFDIQSVVDKEHYPVVRRRLQLLGARGVVAWQMDRTEPELDDPAMVRMMTSIYGPDWQPIKPRYGFPER